MIMMGNKKDRGGALAVILKKIHSGFSDNKDHESEEYKYENPDMESENSLESEAQKILDALDSKNASSLKSALKSFIKMAMREN